MRPDPPSCRPEDAVAQVRAQMHALRMPTLPVTEANGELVGSLTCSTSRPRRRPVLPPVRSPKWSSVCAGKRPKRDTRMSDSRLIIEDESALARELTQHFDGKGWDVEGVANL